MIYIYGCQATEHLEEKAASSIPYEETRPFSHMKPKGVNQKWEGLKIRWTRMKEVEEAGEPAGLDKWRSATRRLSLAKLSA